MRALDKAALTAARALRDRQPRADLTIIQLPTGGTPQATDVLPVWRGGQTYAVTVGGFPAATTGTFNVATYGAVGDGTTSDNGYFSTAQASAGSAALFIPPGTYRLSSSFTFTSPVQFASGARLQLDTGAVATFTAPITAPPSQIFQGTGTVAINGSTVFIYAEWWGAKGDAVTDDAAALNAALQAGYGYNTGGGGGTVVGVSPIVQLLAKTYVHSVPVVISRSGVTLQGMGYGVSYLMGTSNAQDNLQITGTSSANALQYVTVRDLALQCQMLPLTGAGINVTYVNFLRVHDVRITLHAIGVRLTGTNAAEFRGIDVNPVSGTPVNAYGFYIDGTHANNSLNLTECNVNGTGCAASGAFYGFYATGANINDLFLNDCEAGAWLVGFYLNGSAAVTNGNIDIHLRRCVADYCSGNGFFVGAFGQNAQVEIDGGWACADAANGTTAIYVTGSWGVTVRNVHVFQIAGATGGTGIRLATSQNCSIQNNSVHGFQVGIQSDGTSGFNLITGNDIYNLSTVVSALYGIFINTGSTRNAISHNTVGGNGPASWTSGILKNSGTDYCNVVGNVLNPSAMTATLNNNGANTHDYVAGVLT